MYVLKYTLQYIVEVLELLNQIHLIDCREGLRLILSNTVQIIVADPS